MVFEFERQREEELAALRDELIAGSYRHRPYRTFPIYDPKPRIIAAPEYRDRVVHHALVRVLSPIWERGFIHHNYACRLGKGTHRAVVACRGFARRHPYVLKLDVAKFYPSIDHSVLLDLLERDCPDARLREVLRRVIESYEPGLPIGALTSQWFALRYLDPLDHYLTDRLRAKGWLRYMDDGLLFGGSKAELRFMRRRAVDFLFERLRLKAHPGKRAIMRVRDGIPFLGFRVFPSHVRVLTAGKTRARRRMAARVREFASGDRDAVGLRSCICSWCGHWGWADSYYLRKATIGRIRAVRGAD